MILEEQTLNIKDFDFYVELMSDNQKQQCEKSLRICDKKKKGEILICKL